MIFNRIVQVAAGVFMALAATSCFTGVDSTPRITDSEVRRNQAANLTPEQKFLSTLRPLPPARWTAKKNRRIVDDNRFSRVLSPGEDVTAMFKNHVIEFESWAAASSLTGDNVTDIRFRDLTAGRDISVRVPVPATALDTVSSIEIPFTIDLDLVARADSILRGRCLYVLTPHWYDGHGVDVNGLRHVEVVVDSVAPGTYLYPAAVYFSLTQADQQAMARIPSGQKRMLLMSIGGDGAPARSFDKLFTFENPRKRYPAIADDVWPLIMQSRIKAGMSRDECRLALGRPNSIDRYPTRAGMKEAWNYSDGVYLIFDDGYLTNFRQ